MTTEDATVGTVIENKRIVELPLNGRNFLQLVAASPNVSFGFRNAGQAGSRQGGTRTQQNISISGQRSPISTILRWMELRIQTSTSTLISSCRRLMPCRNSKCNRESFRQNLDGQRARSTFPQNLEPTVCMVRFSNSCATMCWMRRICLHQHGYRKPFKWNQYGFTVGGPVWMPKLFNGKDRLFFMTNFEGLRTARRSGESIRCPRRRCARGISQDCRLSMIR